MAGFNAHLTGAAVSSGLLSSSLLMTDIYQPSEIALVWLAGTLGGLLPDIDSDASIALKALFNGLGVLASFAVLLVFKALPLLHLWGIMLAAFILVRYVVMELFARYTAHRGAWHSVLAATVSGLGAVSFSYHVFSLATDLAWAIGLSVFTGFLSHLVLDEMSSIDLSGAEIKRSFGSALKLFSLKQQAATVSLALMAGWCYWSVPKPDRLHHAIFNPGTNAAIVESIDTLQRGNQRLLDDVKAWFANK